MKKIIVTTLVLSLVVLGFGALTVGAHGGGAGQGAMYNNVNQSPNYQQNNVNRLALEDEQLEKITNLQEEYFYQRDELTERLRNKRVELRSEILKDESDERITTIENEIENIQKQIIEAQKEYLNDMRSVLDEEQLNMILEEDYRIGLGNRSFGPRAQGFSYNRSPMYGFGPGQMQFNQTNNGFRSGMRGINRGFCF
ncbi:MAG: hypothetical protein K9K76_06570 [Halanaerobiales bacterium]|nr:hypothetical protein [Halanaerobiales bacterium]